MAIDLNRARVQVLPPPGTTRLPPLQRRVLGRESGEFCLCVVIHAVCLSFPRRPSGRAKVLGAVGRYTGCGVLQSREGAAAGVPNRCGASSGPRPVTPRPSPPAAQTPPPYPAAAPPAATRPPRRWCGPRRDTAASARIASSSGGHLGGGIVAPRGLSPAGPTASRSIYRKIKNSFPGGRCRSLTSRAASCHTSLGSRVTDDESRYRRVVVRVVAAGRRRHGRCRATRRADRG